MATLEAFRDLVNKIVAKNPKRRPIDENGAFYGNPVPIAPPIGYKKQPSMVDVVRDMIRSQRLAEEARAAGFETLEEADDFEIGDDFDPKSPFEYDFDPPSPSLSPASQGEGEGGGAGGVAPKPDPAAPPPTLTPEAPKPPVTPSKGDGG